MSYFSRYRYAIKESEVIDFLKKKRQRGIPLTKKEKLLVLKKYDKYPKYAALVAAGYLTGRALSGIEQRMKKPAKRKKVKESIKTIRENEDYMNFLGIDTRTTAKEWRGPNIPYGDDSNRPNLIRKCTMLESSQLKINCLRKLRDQAAMNPFYQARIDRYVDEITDTYEPTEKPGTIPGNEFKTSGVGEDTKIETVTEGIKERWQGRKEEKRKEKIKKAIETIKYYKSVKRNCRKTEKTPDEIRGCIETADEYITLWTRILKNARGS